MNKTCINLPEVKLVGHAVRTSNARELDPCNAQIGKTVEDYHVSGCAKRLLNREHPGVTYCVYADYESDHGGEYTYFIGEQVKQFEEIPQGCVSLIIPGQMYVKFTSDVGVMPDVCINMWQKIWTMDEKLLCGKRSYIADFELYDKRAQDHEKTVLDLYIGITQKS